MISLSLDVVALVIGLIVGVMVGATITCIIELRAGGAWDRGYHSGWESGYRCNANYKKPKEEEGK